MNEVDIREGVVFGSGGGKELKCDVYSPPVSSGKMPAVVMLHGGGWRGGDRGVMRPFGIRLACEGFVCVASQYRLLPDSVWPAHIHDAKAAIRWTRAHSSELGVDSGRIAILGRSAGGHLALLAAGTAGLPEFEGEGGNPGVGTQVAAAIGIFPPTTFFVGEQRTRGGTGARAVLGEAATEEAARAISPLAYVDSRYPPTMLLHGTGDRVVPPSASMVMYQALVDAQVPAELHMYAEQPHGFVATPEFVDLCSAEIANFLRRYLAVPREAEVAEAVAVR